LTVCREVLVSGRKLRSASNSIDERSSDSNDASASNERNEEEKRRKIQQENNLIKVIDNWIREQPKENRGWGHDGKSRMSIAQEIAFLKGLVVPGSEMDGFSPPASDNGVAALACASLSC